LRRRQRSDTPGRRCPHPKVIEVFLLMAADRNGRISKGDFMNLTEAVFDRLDKDKKGEIDPRQFRQSVRVRGATGR
jgi:Ca2+-binding EF-hand superfamily protein